MLVLAGAGPGRERLEAQVDHAGPCPSALSAGFLNQPRLIDPDKAADLFLLTSKTETQGLVLAEAEPGNARGDHRGEGALDGVRDKVNGLPED